jgi:hypothetical protein
MFNPNSPIELKLNLPKTRYTVQYRSSKRKITLKVTDNVQVPTFSLPNSAKLITHHLNSQCLKYRRPQSIILLNRFEALIFLLMEKYMQMTPPPPPVSAPTPPPPGTTSGKVANAQGGQGAVPGTEGAGAGTSASAGTSGGRKKKKGGKKKK